MRDRVIVFFCAFGLRPCSLGSTTLRILLTNPILVISMPNVLNEYTDEESFCADLEYCLISKESKDNQVNLLPTQSYQHDNLLNG